MRYYGLMPKALKPIIIIVLAVGVAAGAAVYLSRRPEDPTPNAQPAQTVLKNTGGGHFRGPENAKVTLVEFGDYQCPSCRQYHPIIVELLSRYPQQLRLEYHHYPLVSLHANTMAASMAAEAAGEQGHYWEMHDLLFERQDIWSKTPNPEPEFLAMAGMIGLDQNKFMQSMRSPQLQDRILQDVVRARDANVQGTPTFFIDGQIVNIPMSINAFVDAIESRLHNGTGSAKAGE